MLAYLRFGSRGDAVEQVQGGLNMAGRTRFDPLKIDGVFGAKTHARVQEFQGQKRLSVDGVVGPKTQGALQQFIKAFLDHIKNLGTPPHEAAARERIVQIARRMHTAHGWRMHDRLGADRNRIAMNLQADPVTKERQGGAVLAQIAALTGNPNIPAMKCLTISDDAVEGYRANKPDIGKWCAAFIFSVYKLAGLKVGFWPMIHTATAKPNQTPLFTSVLKASDVRPGDYGVSHWERGGENHHFLVFDVKGDGVTTIEGNVGFRVNKDMIPLTIVKRDKFQISEIMKHKTSGFGRPIWKTVL